MKKVKIVATVGPSCESPSMLKRIITAGANCIRINTAFRDLQYYKAIVSRVRKIADVPILLDIKGTDIRFNCKEPITLRKGETLEVGFLKGDCFFSKDFYAHVSVGDTIYLKDGTITAVISKKKNNTVTLKFLTSAELTPHTGVNIPKDIELKPLLSDKDRQVLRFAKQNDIEYIALSFTKTKQDVLEVKKVIKDDSIGIIAKIESAQGVKNVDEILDVCDGIMVARGDLGIEMAKEKVPMIQKQLIRKANIKGKIVITATEMLQSMIKNKRPTRAETSDVANAILDGTDAVMLSAETATGLHPIAAVKEMSAISLETEKYVKTNLTHETNSISEIITGSINHFCSVVDIDKIVTITRSGYTTRMIARFRNNEPILCVTRDNKVKRKLALVYGVEAVQYQNMPATDQILSCAKFCYKKKLLKKTDTVAFTAGTLTKKKGTNTIILVKMEDIL